MLSFNSTWQMQSRFGKHILRYNREWKITPVSEHNMYLHCMIQLRRSDSFQRWIKRLSDKEKLHCARCSTGRRGFDNIPMPLITLCKQLAKAITSIHIAIKTHRLKVLRQDGETHQGIHGNAFLRTWFIADHWLSVTQAAHRNWPTSISRVSLCESLLNAQKNVPLRDGYRNNLFLRHTRLNTVSHHSVRLRTLYHGLKY